MNAPLTTSLTSTEALPTTWVERIFDVMLATFGKKFIDQWVGVEPEKLQAHWAAKLAGYAPAELKRGIDALEKLTFAPTLPEFRALCLGIPSLAAVRDDLRRVDAERMPFTAMVWCHLDGWAYRHADGAKAERLLAEAYATAREAVMRGDATAAREAAMRHMVNAAHRIEHAAPPIRRALDALLTPHPSA